MYFIHFSDNDVIIASIRKEVHILNDNGIIYIYVCNRQVIIGIICCCWYC